MKPSAAQRLQVAVLTLAALFCVVRPIPAYTPMPPLLTKQSVKGRWEGLSMAEARVFLLSIRGAKDSVVTMAVGPPASHINTNVYRSQSLTVNRGSLVLTAVDDGGHRLEIRAKGRAVVGAGAMEGKVKIGGPGGPPSLAFPVKFFMVQGGYTNYLNALVRKAEKAEAAAQP
jgi:hypothetical protein